jgi:hypothetical protein
MFGAVLVTFGAGLFYFIYKLFKQNQMLIGILASRNYAEYMGANQPAFQQESQLADFY